MSAADIAHGVEGFAGDGVGHPPRIPQCVQAVDEYTIRMVLAHDVPPGVWSVILVMGLLATVKMFVQYRATRQPRFRKALIGYVLMSLGILVYLSSDLWILAVPCVAWGFILVVASGVIRGSWTRN